jgi:hypothetical protein
MNSDKDMKDFIANVVDFGKEPATAVLTEAEKRFAALCMAVNAAIVQFINEGVIPIEEQMHFMQHLQDFAERLYRGESLKLPNTGQTLQINSKSGNMFFAAGFEATENGHKNYVKINNMMRDLAAQAKAQQDDSEPVEVIEERPKYLN